MGFGAVHVGNTDPPITIDGPHHSRTDHGTNQCVSAQHISCNNTAAIITVEDETQLCAYHQTETDRCCSAHRTSLEGQGFDEPDSYPITGDGVYDDTAGRTPPGTEQEHESQGTPGVGTYADEKYLLNHRTQGTSRINSHYDKEQYGQYKGCGRCQQTEITTQYQPETNKTEATGDGW